MEGSTEFRIRGRVSRIKEGRGYGFVVGDDGKDYFFHRNGLKKTSARQFPDLREQDRLEFTPCIPERNGVGPRAIEVDYVEG